MDCRAELPELLCFTYGYGGRDPKELAAFVAEYDAEVIDCRLRPWTRQPGWSLSELKERFGEAYHWWRCLGNEHFKGGKPKLKDAKKGLALLVKLIETTSPILLCGERNPWVCHRRLIAEKLQKKTGCRIVHLPVLPPKPKKIAAQLSLDLALPVGHVSGHTPPSRQANASHKRRTRKRK
jgi:uncharacterized protein (DUF488 family)